MLSSNGVNSTAISEAELLNGCIEWNRELPLSCLLIEEMLILPTRPLDTLVTFETASVSPSAPPPVRYAVRQVLDQEYQKNITVRQNAARQARFIAGNSHLDAEPLSSDQKENKTKQFMNEPILETKRDFFGRVLTDGAPLKEIDGNADGGRRDGKGQNIEKVWVSYHEGFSNAVRKPITVEEFLRGL